MTTKLESARYPLAMVALAIAAVQGQGFTVGSLWLICTGLSWLIAASLFADYSRSCLAQVRAIPVLVTALGLWSIATIPFAAAPSAAVLSVFLQLTFVLAFSAAVLSLAAEQAWQRFGSVFALFGLLLSGLAIAQFAGNLPAGLESRFIQRNSLAAYLLLIAFFHLGRFGMTRAAKPVYRYLSLVVAGVALLAIFLSASRGVMLALTLAFAGFYLSLDRHARARCGNLAAALLLVTFLAANLVSSGSGLDTARSIGTLAGAFTGNPDEVSARILLAEQSSVGAVVEGRRGASQRLQLWHGIRGLLPSVPWHGYGPGSFALVYPAHSPPSDASTGDYAHNDFAQTYIELGIPGIGLMVALVVAVIIRRYRWRQRQGRQRCVESEAFFWGAAGILAHSMVSYDLYVPAILVLLAVMLARFDYLTRDAARPIEFDLRKHFRAPLFYALWLCVAAMPCVVLGSAWAMTKAHERGVNALSAGALEQAKDAFDQAHAWFPNAATESARARLYLAAFDATDEAARQAAVLAAARDHNERAAKMNPYDPTIQHVALLLAMRELKTVSQAGDVATYFTSGYEVDPHYHPIKLDFARYLASAGQAKAATAVLREGLKWAMPLEPSVLDYLYFLHALTILKHDEPGAASVQVQIERVRTMLVERS